MRHFAEFVFRQSGHRNSAKWARQLSTSAKTDFQSYKVIQSIKRVGGSRSKERDRKSQLVLRSTYQISEWDRNNSDRNFYNVVSYVHIPIVP